MNVICTNDFITHSSLTQSHTNTLNVGGEGDWREENCHPTLEGEGGRAHILIL